MKASLSYGSENKVHPREYSTEGASMSGTPAGRGDAFGGRQAAGAPPFGQGVSTIAAASSSTITGAGVFNQGSLGAARVYSDVILFPADHNEGWRNPPIPAEDGDVEMTGGGEDMHPVAREPADQYLSPSAPYQGNGQLQGGPLEVQPNNLAGPPGAFHDTDFAVHGEPPSQILSQGFNLHSDASGVFASQEGTSPRHRLVERSHDGNQPMQDAEALATASPPQMRSVEGGHIATDDIQGFPVGTPAFLPLSRTASPDFAHKDIFSPGPPMASTNTPMVSAPLQSSKPLITNNMGESWQGVVPSQPSSSAQAADHANINAGYISHDVHRGYVASSTAGRPQSFDGRPKKGSASNGREGSTFTALRQDPAGLAQQPVAPYTFAASSSFNNRHAHDMHRSFGERQQQDELYVPDAIVSRSTPMSYADPSALSVPSKSTTRGGAHGFGASAPSESHGRSSFEVTAPDMFSQERAYVRPLPALPVEEGMQKQDCEVQNAQERAPAPTGKRQSSQRSKPNTARKKLKSAPKSESSRGQSMVNSGCGLVCSTCTLLRPGEDPRPLHSPDNPRRFCDECGRILDQHPEPEGMQLNAAHIEGHRWSFYILDYPRGRHSDLRKSPTVRNNRYKAWLYYSKDSKDNRNRPDELWDLCVAFPPHDAADDVINRLERDCLRLNGQGTFRITATQHLTETKVRTQTLDLKIEVLSRATNGGKLGEHQHTRPPPTPSRAALTAAPALSLLHTPSRSSYAVSHQAEQSGEHYTARTPAASAAHHALHSNDYSREIPPLELSHGSGLFSPHSVRLLSPPAASRSNHPPGYYSSPLQSSTSAAHTSRNGVSYSHPPQESPLNGPHRTSFAFSPHGEAAPQVCPPTLLTYSPSNAHPSHRPQAQSPMSYQNAEIAQMENARAAFDQDYFVSYHCSAAQTQICRPQDLGHPRESTRSLNRSYNNHPTANPGSGEMKIAPPGQYLPPNFGSSVQPQRPLDGSSAQLCDPRSLCQNPQHHHSLPPSNPYSQGPHH